MKRITEEGSHPIKAWLGMKEVNLGSHTVYGKPEESYEYTEQVLDLEAAALAQLKNIARLPFILGQGIAVMPDAHLGKGATVGSVVPTVGAIIPAAVGVDIGCVDADTEYLSPSGWKRIADYDGGLVMQAYPVTGGAEFIQPEHFIRLPADKFYKFKTKYGVDQMLSPEHRVLYRATSRKAGAGGLSVMMAEEMVETHNKNVSGFSGKFLTTFSPSLSTSVAMSDVELRVAVMVCADGSFDGRKDDLRCVLQFTKDRKLARAEQLLTACGIDFRRDDLTDDRGLVYRLIFNAPIREKSLGAFWAAAPWQLSVIATEAMKWDGWDNKVFYSRDKASADFMQYALSATGYRAVMRTDARGDAVDYRVFANTNTEVGIKSTKKSAIKVVDGAGLEKFCFSVPSTFWVMRRGGNVAITGNCGMNAVRLSIKGSQLPDSLKSIRDAIEAAVPTGKNQHRDDATIQALWERIPMHTKSVGDSLSFAAGGDCMMRKAAPQLGTLGSGNHFVEVCTDENDDVWVMLHSGSRGIGNMIGTYFIDRAKKMMEAYYINLPDTDLAYIPDTTDEFRDYVDAVAWAQDYALENRKVMLENVIDAIRNAMPGVPFELTSEAINCHHNYISRENHYGRNAWVTRKGAIRARDGDLGIIPGSMGQKSYIVRGKGSPESYCSCSHGAGRAMSRAEAKRRFSLADLNEQTAGVECRKDADVIDEIPSSYKNLDVVMALQSDLVEVVHTLKAHLCVKGN